MVAQQLMYAATNMSWFNLHVYWCYDQAETMAWELHFYAPELLVETVEYQSS